MSVDKSITDSMEELKVKASSNDYDDADREWVGDLEKRLEQLGNRSDFSKLYVTQELISALKERIKGYISKKVFTKKMDIRDIDILDAKIEESKDFIRLLTPDYEQELDDLHKTILEKLSI